MKQNIKPMLISNKCLKKLQKKHFKSHTKTQKLLSNSKSFFINNWYIILIISLVCFLLYLKYVENKERKEHMENNNMVQDIEKKPRSVLDYQQVQRVSPNISKKVPKYLY